MRTCIVLFSFLLFYGIVEGTHRSFKFDSSESSLLKGKTIDVSESPPVKSSIAEEFSSSSVTSRLLSGLPAQSNDDDGGPLARTVVFVILVVLLAGIVIVLIWFIFRNPAPIVDILNTKVKVISSTELLRRDNAARVSDDPPETLTPIPSINADFGPKSYSFKELQDATSHFSEANYVGKGGYAKVYKGYLSDKTQVAVKVFERENTKGHREFRHEVDVISRAKHRNIVRLLGYCINDNKRCIVYEFMENRSLQHHLLGGKGIKTLDWPNRMKIAKGTAAGIAYLHDGCSPSIIHRDVKPENILLDFDFDAKVADFGVAKLCPEHFKSHIASYAMGTLGYVDPVYVETKELTFKSDVYSFGVVLLQLVSAVTDLPKLYKLRMEQLPIALKSGNFHCIADLKLDKKYVRDEMALMLTCAEACLRKDREERPAMSLVALVLEGKVPAVQLEPGNIRKRGV